MSSRLLRQMKYVVAAAGLAFVLGAEPAQGGQSLANSNTSINDSHSGAQPLNSAAGVSRVSSDYIIGERDILSIDVWREKEISQDLPVRLDGMISLPLLGDVQASGLTPMQLQEVITQKLRMCLENPQVAVIVKDPQSHQFNIVGQVIRPGTYPLTGNMTVLDALAAAGGFQDFAKKTKIYVLRAARGGVRMRAAFNYREVILGRKLDQNVALGPGDTIVVP